MNLLSDLLSLPKEMMAGIVLIVIAGAYIHFLAFNARTASLAPSLFTTTGIFVTFLGIAIGLLNFDVKNIQGSVPALLDGLRTAFWASVFGVGTALTVKLRVAIWGVPVKKGEAPHPQGATIDDLATHLVSVQQALVGSDDSTLITQLKLGRQESSDRLDSLRRVLDEFTRTMAENNSNALIEALEQVMRDFNAKINEQFGENFKQLNTAVAGILVWQERYREQMGEMIGQQERNTKSLEQASLRFESLVANAERYTQTANDLASLLQAIETQRTSLQDSMMALGQLFVAASKSLPDIETRIVNFADQITRSTKQANDDMTMATRASMDTMRNAVSQVVSGAAEQLGALERSLKAVESTALDCARQIGDGSSKANDVMVRAAHDNANALKAALTDGQKVMANGIAAANDAMMRVTQDNANALKATLVEGQKSLNEGVRAANDGFNSQVQEMISKTKEQVLALDAALQEELTNSLNTLGRQLTGLSQQFVADYTPLTERLRELVAVARRV